MISYLDSPIPRSDVTLTLPKIPPLDPLREFLGPLVGGVMVSVVIPDQLFTDDPGSGVHTFKIANSLAATKWSRAPGCLCTKQTLQPVLANSWSLARNSQED